MASLRFGSFVPNKLGLALAVAYILFFIIYMIGYSMFTSSYHALYEEEEYKAIQSMKWFLVGCPVVILLATILLFVVSSFESRQILLGFSGLLFLGGVGFILIAAWLGANLSRFNFEKGWESCTNKALCAKMKNGLHTFMFGSILCAILSFGDILFCFFRAREIKANEAAYMGLQGEDMDPIHGLDEEEQYFGGVSDHELAINEDEEDHEL